MSVLRGLFGEIRRDGVVNISGINNSSITVSLSSDKVDSFIDEFRTRFIHSLNVFVLSGVKNDGDDSIDEWKPFGVNTLSELVKESSLGLSTDINLVYLSPDTDELEDKFLAYLGYLKMKSIFIVDSEWLSSAPRNENFAKIFDDYSIGGLLIVNRNQSANLTSAIEKSFNYILLYCKHFVYVDSMHIKIDIDAKHKFVNAFREIVKYKLNIRVFDYNSPGMPTLTSPRF